MSRIPYTFARDSIAAVINPNAESRLVQAGIPVVGYPGVRGGGGFLIMPAVTQLFYDNYLSNQAVDQAVGSPWTVASPVTARDENTLIGGLSAEVGAQARIQQSKTLAASPATLSAFVYAPPPVRIDKIYVWWQGTTHNPSGKISLGGHWYFVWKSSTASGAATTYGIRNGGVAGSIWVSCLSLTQTAAPVGFVPNAQTDATQASSDDNLKFTLSEPLPQSGSISFVFIPFADDNAFVDATGILVGFYPSGKSTADGDRFEIKRDASGIKVDVDVGGAGVESTAHALDGFKAFTPQELVVCWDFVPGGTKHVLIFGNGELLVESTAISAIPTSLVDMWVGVQRNGASSYGGHAQGITQDIQIHRR